MKKIFFLLISQIIFSQIEKNIGDFQELKALDGINVILEKSSENNIKITGDNTENVVVINKSGTLILRMQLVKKLKGQNTVVKLKHKSRIFLIEAKQSATVISKDTLKQSTMYLKSASGGKIELNLQTEKTTATVNSGGVVNIKGSTFSFEATAKSGGVIKANSFLSSQTKVSASSGGSCKAYARDIFEAKACTAVRIRSVPQNPFLNEGVFYSKNPLKINTSPIIKIITFTAILIFVITSFVKLLFSCCAKYILPKSIEKYVPTIAKKNITILYSVS